MRKLTKKELSKIEIQKTKHGFVIWVNSYSKKLNMNVRHWIVDASTFLENGKLMLGDNKYTDYENQMIKKEDFFGTYYLLMKKSKKELK